MDICFICRFPFASDEWESRHSTIEGEDCHWYCCDTCNEEDLTAWE